MKKEEMKQVLEGEGSKSSKMIEVPEGHEGCCFNREQAQEVYDFIRTHLEVVNKESHVEGLMFWLEEQFDL